MKTILILLTLIYISCENKSKTEHTYMIEVTEYFTGGGRHGRVYHDSKKTKTHWRYSFNDTLKGYFDTYTCVYDSVLRSNTGIDSVEIEIYEK